MTSDDHPIAVLTELPGVPDFLGRASRVESVAGLLQQAQEQLQRLYHVMVLNNEDPSDKIATMEGGDERPTYQERLDSLREGMSTLWKQNEDIKEELTAEAVKRRKAIEQKMEERA